MNFFHGICPQAPVVSITKWPLTFHVQARSFCCLCPAVYGHRTDAICMERGSGYPYSGIK
jgi:hypothetical protein